MQPSSCLWLCPAAGWCGSGPWLADQQLWPGFASVLDNLCLLPTERCFGAQIAPLLHVQISPCPKCELPQRSSALPVTNSTSFRGCLLLGFGHGPNCLFLMVKLSSVYQRARFAYGTKTSYCLEWSPLVGSTSTVPAWPTLPRHFHLPKDPQNSPGSSLHLLMSWCTGASHAPCSCGEGPCCWPMAWISSVHF